MIKKILVLSCLALVISQCEPAEDSTGAQFEQLLENYYEEGVRLDPIEAMSFGDARYTDRFPNLLSQDYADSLREYYRTYREKVSAFEDAQLNETQRMSKAVLEWECTINLETLEFDKYRYLPIDQMWSVNLYMGQLASGTNAQPFNSVEDYRNWLSRVDEYLEWLQTAEANMREGMKKGYVLPKSLIRKVIPQMEAMTGNGGDVENHLFYSPVEQFPDDFSDQEKDELRAAYRDTITNKIIPAYRELHDFMQNEYLPAGRETSGIAGIPNGEAYYRHQIKKYTTTDMTADEIHQLGLDEVKRISAEMEKVKEQIGYEDDLQSFFDYVRTNPELMPYDSPDEVIAHFQEIHDRVKPNVDSLFSVKPETPFEIRRTEAFREKSASAEYNPGSMDGTRPGIFYVPVPNASEYNVYGDESLFLHEAIPGHHYQISLTQENDQLPEFRKALWYSGYGEGWALYAESLGKELGLYTDPYQYFGMLSAEMHRAIRLVVDTGLHSRGWTREQAIQYSLDHEAASEAGITSEIERYMANPGQALSYKIGQIKIRELREKARTRLADEFDIRAYHAEVLETGCIPLSLLEEKINNWIAENE
ncbi:DUF885 domain-containing protein [Aliifodinibius sp. S!AR15-10]|uniref:DUF885 domain-containing protein n=1 Tax=Aliifodinibius sp. S!AR15-10 TaxID=2950437 RepID=UPI00285650D0|nr:DUF885 domain-containing protein [Aliifodinibius sp. S!AR15-10]MDR8389580.1 DUF885 domain-containing protein [Aliifodinibius sp. S!AR15-10]